MRIDWTPPSCFSFYFCRTHDSYTWVHLYVRVCMCVRARTYVCVRINIVSVYVIHGVVLLAPPRPALLHLCAAPFLSSALFPFTPFTFLRLDAIASPPLPYPDRHPPHPAAAAASVALLPLFHVVAKSLAHTM